MAFITLVNVANLFGFVPGPFLRVKEPFLRQLIKLWVTVNTLMRDAADLFIA